MSFVSRNELTGAPVQHADPALGYPVMPGERRSEGLTIDFRGILGALRRRKWWVIGPVILGMLAGLAFALTITPRYNSSIQILVDPRDVQVVKTDTPLRTPSPDGSTTLAENAMIMLRSANVLMQVVERLKLEDDTEFVGKPGLLSRSAGVDSIEVRRLRAMNALDRRLTTRRSEKSSVVEVSVWTIDAQKSALVANTLGAVFLEQQTALEVDTARRAAQSTSARLSELGARVEKAERDVEEYRARNNLQAANGRLVSEQQLQELNSQLVLARARSADTRARYEAARKLTVAGIERGELPESVNSQLIGQLRLKYAEASRLETDARMKLGERHPEMIALAAQSRDMRAQLMGELNRIARAAQTEYERAKAAEDGLQSALDQARTQSTDTSEASVRLRELERQAEASRSIYAAFLKRARELSEQEDINPIAARIVSAANPAQWSTSLSRSFAVLGATIGAGLLGLFLALVLEQFDGTLRNRRQFQELSGLPVIAEYGSAATRRGEGAPLRAPVLESPRSPSALGAFRIADTFAARASIDEPRSVLFLSVGGVSTTELVLNVSIAAAQAGWRVLLVDANAIGDSVSQHLEVRPQHGLNDVLAGNVRLSQAVMTDERTKVRILANTGETTRPGRNGRSSAQQIAAQLFARPRQYELTFVDGGEWGRDALAYAFAGAVDDIVLVAEAGTISSREVRDVLDTLGPFADRLAGIVTV